MVLQGLVSDILGAGAFLTLTGLSHTVGATSLCAPSTCLSASFMLSYFSVVSYHVAREGENVEIKWGYL